MPSPPGPDAVPSAIGRYEVLRELGRGAMGVVYEARDPALSRSIALKTILPAPPGEQEAFEERFFLEARIAARLSHPGIVVVHDVGRDPATGILYIALEHLRGKTLAEAAREGPLDWREVCRLGAQIARALHHAHLQGVVHRDMKPANVMLLPTGQTKIMDFGIARIETARFRRPGPGDFLGTPLYAAPEQATTGQADARTDIFALGSIAYTLLTGQPAFAADDVRQIVERVVNHDPPPPSRLVRGIPEALDRVVARAMAKGKEHRYPDAKALAEDLEAVQAGRAPAHASEAARIAAITTWELPRTEAASAVEPPGGRDEGLESVLQVLVDDTPPAPSSGTAGTERGSSGPRRPGRRRAWLAAAVLLLAGFAIGYLALHLRGAAASPDGSPATAATSPSPTSARPEPTPREAASRSREAAPPGTARAPLASPDVGSLEIDLDHGLRRGVLRVWVDGRPVIEEKLAGTVRKKALVFQQVKGTFRDVVTVSPGVHTIRMQVTWEDNEKTEEITGAFRPGETRTLEANLGGLRKGLDLEWK